VALGVPGSGKTTAMRRILRMVEAPDSEVLEVVQDKPDSLRATLESHHIIVLDNLEKSGARWLVDVLNRIVTGSNIELRKLYATNGLHTIKPRCFVALTAVSMPFSDETLFSRMLPVELSQIQAVIPEREIQAYQKDNRSALWADLLQKLSAVVRALRANLDSGTLGSGRLADFTSFCHRIRNSGSVDGELLIKGIRNLVDQQRMALMAASPFVTILEEWLTGENECAGRFLTLKDLYGKLEPLARLKRMEWRWNNATSLSRHILTLRPGMERLYSAEFKEESVHGQQEYSVKFPKR